MTHYMEKLNTVLNDIENITDETILKILHDYHLENSAEDTVGMKRKFEQMDQLLNELTPENYERIWNTSMAISSDHERRGFDAGFRMGVSLMRELSGAGQGN